MTSNIQIYWQAILRNAVRGTPLPPDFATIQKALGISAAQTQNDLADAQTYLLNRAIAATAPACKSAIAASNLAQTLAADQAVTPSEMALAFSASQTQSNELSGNLNAAKIALVGACDFEQKLLPVMDGCTYVNLLEMGRI